VTAGEASDGNFATYVWRERGGVTAASGMRGPKLYDDEPINTFFGQSDGMPPFVLVRAHSRVAAVTVHSDSGEEYRLDLSATDDEFGLKFAAGPLRDGEHPVSFVAHLGDGNEWQREVRMST